MKESSAWWMVNCGSHARGQGLPAGTLAPSSMRVVGFFLTTFALIWRTYGNLLSDIDSYLPACISLLEGALDNRCASEFGANGTTNSQLWRGQRRELLGAIWKCQGLLEGSANASSPSKLRVLVWDTYEPWLTPALDRFSGLYGIPLDLDVQPLGQLMSSIHARPRPSLAEAPTGTSQPAFQQQPPTQQQQQQQSGGAGPHALWLYSSALTQEIAEDGHLLDLGELIEQEQYGIDWFNIGQSYRLQLMPYAGRTVAIPLDGTLLHFFYRKDMLQTLNPLAQVPKTWTQLVEFTMSYQPQVASSGAAPGYGVLAPYPICIARDVGCRHESYLQAIWSSIALTHGSAQPIHFDTDTMQPLLNSSAAAAAFRILAQLLAAAAPPEPDEGCSQGSLAFARGRCVFALAGFVAQMRMLSESGIMDTAPPAGGAAVVRVSELPGSELVWDGSRTSGEDGAGGTAGLTPCTHSTCPYGISGTIPASAAAAWEWTQVASEQQQQEVLINRAPQAPTSLLVGGVNSRMPPMVKLVAFELLAFLAAPDYLDGDGGFVQSTLKFPQASLRSVFPVQPYLLQPEQRDVWLAAGYDMDMMQDAMPVLYGSMTHPNIAWGLRMPGQAAYNKLIGDVIASILAGNVSVARWVSSEASAQEGETSPSQAGATPLAHVLSSATAKLTSAFTFQNASRLYDESRQPWVYAPLDIAACMTRGALQPRAPLPSSQDLAREPPPRHSGLLPVILGVLVPLVVLCLIVVMLVRRYYSQSTTGFDGVGGGMGGYGRGVWCLSMALRGPRKIHVPEAGVQVALCVTDIQDSTSLWENLPADTLARAVDIHHHCVRRLALKHGGYESATEGDSFILAFSSVRSAVAFALDLQTQLLNAPSWPKLLLEQEVCKPVYTRLPAGYPLSNAASSRANGISPRVRRSSRGVVTATAAGLAARPPARAASVELATTVAAVTVTGIAEDLAHGSGSGMGAVTSARTSATTARRVPASLIASCADRSRLRSSAGSPLGQPSPRPQLRHGPTTCGSGPSSRDGSAVLPRGRSLEDLVRPSVQMQGSQTAGDGGGVTGSRGGCSSACSGLRFPEPAAAAAITPVPLGAGVATATTGSLHGGSGAVISASAASMASYSPPGCGGAWCHGDVGSLEGTSAAEEVDSSPIPLAPAVPIRSDGRLKQQLSWLEEPAGSSGSLGQPFGMDGTVPSSKTSMTNRMAISEAGGGGAQPYGTLPEEALDVQRSHMLPCRQQPHHHYHQQFMPSPAQQHLSPLILSRGSAVFRGAHGQQSPTAEGDLLPTWCDSGFLAHANFSVYSNTTYGTTAEGMAGAGGAAAAGAASRLWDDAEGDFISSASNAILCPTSYQSVVLGPLSAGMMGFGAQGPASAAAAGGVPEAAASPAMAADRSAGGDEGRLAGGGGGGGSRTLLEVLRAAAAAAAAAGVAGERLGVQATSSDLSTSCQHRQPSAHTQQQRNDHNHPNGCLVFRGLRVRVGISVAVPTAAELQYNAAAARMVYGGPCVAACKALADLAHGGQVFLSARAHQVLAAECQGLGGKPPGTMVLQVALMESSAALPQPPQLQEQQTNVANSTGNLARDSCLLPPGQGAPVLHSRHVADCTLPRVPDQNPCASTGPQQRHAVPTLTATYRAFHKVPKQVVHQLQIQPSVTQQVSPRVHLGLEPVYLVTAPTLSQRLALVPPPRFSTERPPLQDVYRAPLGHVSYVVVRVPAAAALLRWNWPVAETSLKMFVRTAMSELRRATGAYLVLASPAEIRAAFPSPVLAVAWALNLRAALLRATWPEELLQHELGEPVEAYDSTEMVGQPPSELGIPRLRWMSLTGFGRGTGSRESNVQRSGGGSGSGGAVTESQMPPLPVRFRGVQRRIPSRPGSTQAVAMSRAVLLRPTSPKGDGAGDQLGGSLEPLPRMGASPPLRRNRYSLEYVFPMSETQTQGTVPVPAVRASTATIAPVDEPAFDSPSETSAIAQQAPCSSQIPSSSQTDYQKRALALLADHFRNSAMAATACETRGSASDGGVSIGVGSVHVIGRPRGYLPSTPLSLPFGSSPLSGATTPLGCALRRATVDGIAPVPQRQYHYQHQTLFPKQRVRMAAPVAVSNNGQRWEVWSVHRPHHLTQQQTQQQNKGSESGEAAAAAPFAHVGCSSPASFSRPSLQCGGTDVQLAEDSPAAVDVTEGERVELEVAGRGGGCADADGSSVGGTPASTESSLHAFPMDATDAAVTDRDPRSKLNSGLHDPKTTSSRPRTWTSPNSYGDDSGAAIRCSDSGVPDTGRGSCVIGGTALRASGTGHIFLPIIGPGSSPLRAAGDARAAEGMVPPPSPQPRSAPLYTAPPLSASPHIPRRNAVHENAERTAVINAHADANAATAAAMTARQQATEGGGGRNGRLLLRGLRIHVGVATGSLDWTVSSKTHALVYTGRAVSRAVRLCEAAASGKVLCDRGTHRGILHVQTQLATATGIGTVQSVSPPAAYFTPSGGLTPPPPRLSDPRTYQQQEQQPRQDGFERNATTALGSGLRFGTCNSGTTASPAERHEEDHRGVAAAAAGPSTAAVPPAPAVAATATAVSADDIAAECGGSGGGGGGAKEMLSEQVALELQLVRLFAGARLTVRTMDDVFLCEFRSALAHTLPRPLQVPVPTSPPPPLTSSTSPSVHQLNCAGGGNVAPHHGLQRTQLPTATYTSGLHPHCSSPRWPQSPLTSAHSTNHVSQIPMPCIPAATSQDLVATSSPGPSGHHSSEVLHLRMTEGRTPRLQPQLSVGADAEEAAAAAVAAVYGGGSSSTGGGGGGFIVEPLPALSVCMTAATASPPQGPGMLPPALQPGTWSCSTAATSDCGYMPSLPMSSGHLSSTSALPQFSVARISPAQRFTYRGMLTTTEGNMPYIVCERVDEEGEAGSEDGSGKGQPASATAASSNAVACSGEVMAGAGGIGAPRRLDDGEDRKLCECDLSPPYHVQGKVMQSQVEANAETVSCNGSGNGYGNSGTMPAAAPRTQRTDFKCSDAGGGPDIVGRGRATTEACVPYFPHQPCSCSYGPGPVWLECDDRIHEGSQQREVALASSAREMYLEGDAGNQRAASMGAPVACYAPYGGGRNVLSPAVKERPTLMLQPLPPLGLAWRQTSSSGRSEMSHLAGRPRGQWPMTSAPTAISGGGCGGQGWGLGEAQLRYNLHEDDCMRDDEAVQGEFEVMPTGSRCCSGPGGASTTSEVTVRTLLQGRLLGQMAAVARTDVAVGSTTAPLAQSPSSPALLMTIGSSGRRGSVNMSGSSYLCNSGSGGVILNPPTFAGMAQLPPDDPSVASSAGSSFRLVPFTEHLQP
ncbi:hypothetical protein Vafri_19932 [Volvox africanus]|uniref:Guanylate cyclase domain-containing protein n=1 Tax=Volvox africanus TaxID=51714 RepID=A0A8J4BVY0_9CHLO|nr:hypothetical protein Vafri_19932 [Volvox africanus]